MEGGCLYYAYNKIITKNECEFLINDCLQAPVIQAVTSKSPEPIEAVRKTDVRWVRNLSFIQYGLVGLLDDANQRLFRYIITAHESVQFASYSDGGHYTWHTDVTRGTEAKESRKLSTVILLSDPNDFEGGHFEMFGGEEGYLRPLEEQGSVIVMDCFDWHRVTPVTKGVRHSLVMWSHGPNLQ